jgi:catabolite regulation protein CreA
VTPWPVARPGPTSQITSIVAGDLSLAEEVVENTAANALIKDAITPNTAVEDDKIEEVTCSVNMTKGHVHNPVPLPAQMQVQ